MFLIKKAIVAALIAAGITIGTIGLFGQPSNRTSTKTSPIDRNSPMPLNPPCNCQVMNKCPNLSHGQSIRGRFCGFEGFQRKVCCDTKNETVSTEAQAQAEAHLAESYKNSNRYKTEELNHDTGQGQTESLVTDNKNITPIDILTLPFQATATTDRTLVTSEKSKMTFEGSESTSKASELPKTITESLMKTIDDLFGSSPSSTQESVTNEPKQSRSSIEDLFPDYYASQDSQERSSSEGSADGKDLVSDGGNVNFKDPNSVLAQFFPDYYEELIKNLTVIPEYISQTDSTMTEPFTDPSVIPQLNTNDQSQAETNTEKSVSKIVTTSTEGPSSSNSKLDVINVSESSTEGLRQVEPESIESSTVVLEGQGPVVDAKGAGTEISGVGTTISSILDVSTVGPTTATEGLNSSSLGTKYNSEERITEIPNTQAVADPSVVPKPNVNNQSEEMNAEKTEGPSPTSSTLILPNVSESTTEGLAQDEREGIENSTVDTSVTAQGTEILSVGTTSIPDMSALAPITAPEALNSSNSVMMTDSEETTTDSLMKSSTTEQSVSAIPTTDTPVAFVLDTERSILPKLTSDDLEPLKSSLETTPTEASNTMPSVSGIASSSFETESIPTPRTESPITPVSTTTHGIDTNQFDLDIPGSKPSTTERTAEDSDFTISNTEGAQTATGASLVEKILVDDSKGTDSPNELVSDFNKSEGLLGTERKFESLDEDILESLGKVSTNEPIKSYTNEPESTTSNAIGVFPKESAIKFTYNSVSEFDIDESDTTTPSDNPEISTDKHVENLEHVSQEQSSTTKKSDYNSVREFDTGESDTTTPSDKLEISTDKHVENLDHVSQAKEQSPTRMPPPTESPEESYTTIANDEAIMVPPESQIISADSSFQKDLPGTTESFLNEFDKALQNKVASISTSSETLKNAKNLIIDEVTTLSPEIMAPENLVEKFTTSPITSTSISPSNSTGQPTAQPESKFSEETTTQSQDFKSVTKGVNKNTLLNQNGILTTTETTKDPEEFSNYEITTLKVPLRDFENTEPLLSEEEKSPTNQPITFTPTDSDSTKPSAVENSQKELVETSSFRTQEVETTTQLNTQETSPPPEKSSTDLLTKSTDSESYNTIPNTIDISATVAPDSQILIDSTTQKDVPNPTERLTSENAENQVTPTSSEGLTNSQNLLIDRGTTLSPDPMAPENLDSGELFPEEKEKMSTISPITSTSLNTPENYQTVRPESKISSDTTSPPAVLEFLGEDVKSHDKSTTPEENEAPATTEPAQNLIEAQVTTLKPSTRESKHTEGAILNEIENSSTSSPILSKSTEVGTTPASLFKISSSSSPESNIPNDVTTIGPPTALVYESNTDNTPIVTTNLPIDKFIDSVNKSDNARSFEIMSDSYTTMSPDNLFEIQSSSITSDEINNEITTTTPGIISNENENNFPATTENPIPSNPTISSTSKSLVITPDFPEASGSEKTTEESSTIISIVEDLINSSTFSTPTSTLSTTITESEMTDLTNADSTTAPKMINSQSIQVTTTRIPESLEFETTSIPENITPIPMDQESPNMSTLSTAVPSMSTLNPSVIVDSTTPKIGNKDLDLNDSTSTESSTLSKFTTISDIDLTTFEPSQPPELLRDENKSPELIITTTTPITEAQTPEGVSVIDMTTPIATNMKSPSVSNISKSLSNSGETTNIEKADAETGLNLSTITQSVIGSIEGATPLETTTSSSEIAENKLPEITTEDRTVDSLELGTTPESTTRISVKDASDFSKSEEVTPASPNIQTSTKPTIAKIPETSTIPTPDFETTTTPSVYTTSKVNEPLVSVNSSTDPTRTLDIDYLLDSIQAEAGDLSDETMEDKSSGGDEALSKAIEKTLDESTTLESALDSTNEKVQENLGTSTKVPGQVSTVMSTDEVSSTTTAYVDKNMEIDSPATNSPMNNPQSLTFETQTDKNEKDSLKTPQEFMLNITEVFPTKNTEVVGGSKVSYSDDVEDIFENEGSKLTDKESNVTTSSVFPEIFDESNSTETSISKSDNTQPYSSTADSTVLTSTTSSLNVDEIEMTSERVKVIVKDSSPLQDDITTTNNPVIISTTLQAEAKNAVEEFTTATPAEEVNTLKVTEDPSVTPDKLITNTESSSITQDQDSSTLTTDPDISEGSTRIQSIPTTTEAMTPTQSLKDSETTVSPFDISGSPDQHLNIISNTVPPMSTTQKSDFERTTNTENSNGIGKLRNPFYTSFSNLEHPNPKSKVSDITETANELNIEVPEPTPTSSMPETTIQSLKPKTETSTQSSIKFKGDPQGTSTSPSQSDDETEGPTQSIETTMPPLTVESSTVNVSEVISDMTMKPIKFTESQTIKSQPEASISDQVTTPQSEQFNTAARREDNLELTESSQGVSTTPPEFEITSHGPEFEIVVGTTMLSVLNETGMSPSLKNSSDATTQTNSVSDVDKMGGMDTTIVSQDSTKSFLNLESAEFTTAMSFIKADETTTASTIKSATKAENSSTMKSLSESVSDMFTELPTDIKETPAVATTSPLEYEAGTTMRSVSVFSTPQTRTLESATDLPPSSEVTTFDKIKNISGKNDPEDSTKAMNLISDEFTATLPSNKVNPTTIISNSKLETREEISPTTKSGETSFVSQLPTDMSTVLPQSFDNSEDSVTTMPSVLQDLKKMNVDQSKLVDSDSSTSPHDFNEIATQSTTQGEISSTTTSYVSQLHTDMSTTYPSSSDNSDDSVTAMPSVTQDLKKMNADQSKLVDSDSSASPNDSNDVTTQSTTQGEISSTTKSTTTSHELPIDMSTEFPQSFNSSEDSVTTLPSVPQGLTNMDIIHQSELVDSDSTTSPNDFNEIATQSTTQDEISSTTTSHVSYLPTDTSTTFSQSFENQENAVTTMPSLPQNPTKMNTGNSAWVDSDSSTPTYLNEIATQSTTEGEISSTTRSTLTSYVSQLPTDMPTVVPQSYENQETLITTIPSVPQDLTEMNIDQSRLVDSDRSTPPPDFNETVPDITSTFKYSPTVQNVTEKDDDETTDSSKPDLLSDDINTERSTKELPTDSNTSIPEVSSTTPGDSQISLIPESITSTPEFLTSDSTPSVGETSTLPGEEVITSISRVISKPKVIIDNQPTTSRSNSSVEPRTSTETTHSIRKEPERDKTVVELIRELSKVKTKITQSVHKEQNIPSTMDNEMDTSTIDNNETEETTHLAYEVTEGYNQLEENSSASLMSFIRGNYTELMGVTEPPTESLSFDETRSNGKLNLTLDPLSGKGRAPGARVDKSLGREESITNGNSLVFDDKLDGRESEHLKPIDMTSWENSTDSTVEISQTTGRPSSAETIDTTPETIEIEYVTEAELNVTQSTPLCDQGVMEGSTRSKLETEPETLQIREEFVTLIPSNVNEADTTPAPISNHNDTTGAQQFEMVIDETETINSTSSDVLRSPHTQSITTPRNLGRAEYPETDSNSNISVIPNNFTKTEQRLQNQTEMPDFAESITETPEFMNPTFPPKSETFIHTNLPSNTSETSPPHTKTSESVTFSKSESHSSNPENQSLFNLFNEIFGSSKAPRDSNYTNPTPHHYSPRINNRKLVLEISQPGPDEARTPPVLTRSDELTVSIKIGPGPGPTPGARALYPGEAMEVEFQLQNQISNVVNQLLLTTHENFRLLPSFIECASASRRGRRKTRVLNFDTENYPWMARIGYQEPGGVTFSCAGTIISRRYILTSAYCAYKKPGAITEVLLESAKHLSKPSELNYKYKVDKVIPHPEYDPSSRLNDLALLRLTSDIEFNSSSEIKPICLPFEDGYGVWDSMPKVGDLAYLGGWGFEQKNKTKIADLQESSVRIWTNENCTKSFEGDRKKEITSNQICAYASPENNACRGDAGAPLMAVMTRHRIFFQIGVVSYGPQCGNRVPRVYTRISAYLRWILAVMEP